MWLTTEDISDTLFKYFFVTNISLDFFVFIFFFENLACDNVMKGISKDIFMFYVRRISKDGFKK